MSFPEMVEIVLYPYDQFSAVIWGHFYGMVEVDLQIGRQAGKETDRQICVYVYVERKRVRLVKIILLTLVMLTTGHHVGNFNKLLAGLHVPSTQLLI